MRSTASGSSTRCPKPPSRRPSPIASSSPRPTSRTTNTVDRLQQRLEAMNPFALITKAINGELDPALLANIGPQSVSARSEELGRWLNVILPESREAGGRRSSSPADRAGGGSTRRCHSCFLSVVRRTFYLGRTERGAAGAHVIARAGSTPGEGYRPRGGRTRSRRIAGSATCVSSAGDARARARYRSSLAHRIHRAQHPA